eukprot:GHVT01011186.1.p1 GENE.GHVT01011186.1~~GHVT01011186.1.p1  ORF type:complete len:774 (-),score=67.27 GHVT01011186.1:162-2483(-)
MSITMSKMPNGYQDMVFSPNEEYPLLSEHTLSTSQKTDFESSLHDETSLSPKKISEETPIEFKAYVVACDGVILLHDIESGGRLPNKLMAKTESSSGHPIVHHNNKVYEVQVALLGEQCPKKHGKYTVYFFNEVIGNFPAAKFIRLVAYATLPIIVPKPVGYAQIGPDKEGPMWEVFDYDCEYKNCMVTEDLELKVDAAPKLPYGKKKVFLVKYEQNEGFVIVGSESAPSNGLVHLTASRMANDANYLLVFQAVGKKHVPNDSLTNAVESEHVFEGVVQEESEDDSENESSQSSTTGQSDTESVNEEDDLDLEDGNSSHGGKTVKHDVFAVVSKTLNFGEVAVGSIKEPSTKVLRVSMGKFESQYLVDGDVPDSIANQRKEFETLTPNQQLSYSKHFEIEIKSQRKPIQEQPMYEEEADYHGYPELNTFSDSYGGPNIFEHPEFHSSADYDMSTSSTRSSLSQSPSFGSQPSFKTGQPEMHFKNQEALDWEGSHTKQAEDSYPLPPRMGFKHQETFGLEETPTHQDEHSYSPRPRSRSLGSKSERFRISPQSDFWPRSQASKHLFGSYAITNEFTGPQDHALPEEWYNLNNQKLNYESEYKNSKYHQYNEKLENLEGSNKHTGSKKKIPANFEVTSSVQTWDVAHSGMVVHDEQGILLTEFCLAVARPIPFDAEVKARKIKNLFTTKQKKFAQFDKLGQRASQKDGSDVGESVEYMKNRLIANFNYEVWNATMELKGARYSAKCAQDQSQAAYAGRVELIGEQTSYTVRNKNP